MSRRGLFKIALTGIGAYGLGSSPSARAAPPEIKVPDGVTEHKFDFDTKGIEGWTLVRGQWVVEDFPGAPVGKKALLQRETRKEFNVIVAPAGPFTDVDISVKFDPLSGKEDASGGIVFRFTDGKYYVVRANALEGNFRLYYYDGAAVNWRAPVSSLRRSLSGTCCGSLPSVTTSRAGSTAPCCSTTETRASSQVEWGCGQRPIRSRRSTTSPFVV